MYNTVINVSLMVNTVNKTGLAHKYMIKYFNMEKVLSIDLCFQMVVVVLIWVELFKFYFYNFVNYII
jgi:hypothetical protein